jgi:hypothetical protein
MFSPAHKEQTMPEMPWSDCQPMPSTQVRPGEYEVVGTARHVTVNKEKVYRHMGGGIEWVLYVDGKRYRTFDTKREALVYCQYDASL